MRPLWCALTGGHQWVVMKACIRCSRCGRITLYDEEPEGHWRPVTSADRHRLTCDDHVHLSETGACVGRSNGADPIGASCSDCPARGEGDRGNRGKRECTCGKHDNAHTLTCPAR